MRLKLYDFPYEVGWLGWIENSQGEPVAFVALSGTLVFEW